MKLRWRKRASVTVLHFSVLMTLGSALPLAISSSRPFLSMGARHPVRAVLATAVLATVWVMRFLLFILIQTVLYYAGAVPAQADAKNPRESDSRDGGRQGVDRFFA